MYIELNWHLWRFFIGFRVKWHTTTLTLILLEYVEDEIGGVLWFALAGIFIGIGFKK